VLSCLANDSPIYCVAAKILSLLEYIFAATQALKTEEHDSQHTTIFHVTDAVFLHGWPADMSTAANGRASKYKH
jgi:hypothetical protein